MRRFCVCWFALSAVWLGLAAQLRAQQPGLRPATQPALQPAQRLGQPSGAQPQLKRFAVPPLHLEAVATRLGLRYRDQPDVTVSSDSQAGELLVLAPPAAQETILREVQQLLEARQRQAQQDSGEPLRVQLTQISWRQFERNLQQVAGGSVPVTTSQNGRHAAFQLHELPLGDTTVEVDRQTNRVTVVAPAPKRPGWQQLIDALDRETRRPGEVVRVIRLRHAEPAPVQQAIRLLRELEPVDAEAIPTTKPEFARSPLQPAVFQSPANQPPAGDERPQTVVVPEAQDEADEQAEQDTAEEDAGAGVIGDTEIQFVPELGVIIIKGAERDVQRVREVIEEIERQSEITQPEVRVRQLEYANSNAVAQLLQQLYEDVLSARQGEVSITALDAPNALLLIGREEALAGVLELIQKIDRPLKDEDRLRVFRLRHASAVDAEETIRNFFTAQPGVEEELRPGLGIRVRIVADYRTNSLIVSASPRDMTEVTRLINQLDVRDVPAENQIKVFPLNNAIAEDLVDTLRAAITGEGEDEGPQELTRPSTSLSIVSLDAEGDRVLDSGVLAGVTIAADENAIAVVVRAPAPSMPLIRELIRQLDQAPNIDSLVKVFTIENGDAAQLTTALQELFGEEAAVEGTSVGAGNIAALAAATASESSLVPLRFSTDVRTNSIIASGSAADLDVVESILLRLDSEGFAERITEVIWLEHQIAENVAAAIQQYVQQRVQTVNTIQQYQQGLGPFDLPDRDLIVVAEPQSNSLLLSVAPRLYEDVRRLIDNLDRRPPMVMIKVVLAEVELNDSFEIGGELGLQDSLLFNRGITAEAFQGQDPVSDPGFNFNDANLPNENSFGQEDLAGRAVSTFGVGTVSAAEGVGGFVLSAASESVSLLFRTLQTAGRLQVISRPQVMTMDNTEALVQVGQQIARPSSVNVTQNTTTIGVAEEDVGLILRVTPRVGADGLIVMDIDATRSSLNQTAPGQPIGIFEGNPVTVQPIDKTTAQSTITAYSGQTVIFGGLIQKRRENISRRVPYLADIPLLGYMFKFDREVERRSELLVVMTPMLITGEQDLQYVKRVESSRMSWCLADVVEAHGDVGLSGGYGLWGPAVGPTIYPDLQPTVDQMIVHDAPLPAGAAPHGHAGAPYGPDGAVHVPPGMSYHGGRAVPHGETVLEAEPPMIESRPERVAPGEPAPVLPPPAAPGAYPEYRERPEFQPEAYGPDGYRPEEYRSEEYRPEGYGPEAYGPEGYGPEGYRPEEYRPGAYGPEAYGPEAYEPDAASPRRRPRSPGVAPPYTPGVEPPGAAAPSEAAPPEAVLPERGFPRRGPRSTPSSSDRPGARQGMLNGPRGEVAVRTASGQRTPAPRRAVRQSSYAAGTDTAATRAGGQMSADRPHRTERNGASHRFLPENGDRQNRRLAPDRSELDGGSQTPSRLGTPSYGRAAIAEPASAAGGQSRRSAYPSAPPQAWMR